jgi:hypothetical protein
MKAVCEYLAHGGSGELNSPLQPTEVSLLLPWTPLPGVL